METIKLKVAEAHQDDINKGVVRVDSQFFRKIGLSPGDVIGIKGEKETVAIVDRAYPSDLGLELIRMDGTIRKNAKIGIGEQVKIFKPELKKAQKITITPLQELQLNPIILSNIKKGLNKKPITQFDIVTLANSNERRNPFSSSNPFAIDILFVDSKNYLGFNLGNLKFKIVSTKPSGFLVITQETIIEITNTEEEEKEIVNYEDIGGLRDQLSKVRELVELPLKHPEIFTRLGITPPKGILLFGPPGTGKTLLARAIANETEASFYSISAPEIVNKYYGESEKKLREFFEKAQKDSPAIIFIDEIDAIAAKRKDIQGETEKRIVAQLLTLMDGLNKNKKIIVIAATNRPDAIDEALRRPGRFDRELEIGIPKEKDRLEILKIHSRGMPIELPKKFKNYELVLKNFKKNNPTKKIELEKIKLDFEKNIFNALYNLPKEIVQKVMKKESDKILIQMAKITHGFVGADIEALVKEAAFNVLRRTFPNGNIPGDEKLSIEILNKLEITLEDFTEALKLIRPSAMREFLVEVPNVRWDQIGGLENLKKELTEMIEWPLKHPESFKKLGIKSPKGILLYGPPGTGKTLLAKAVATETESNFIYVKGPELISKGFGDTEKSIRELFKKARQNSPSILFFDEFDSIAKIRVGGSESFSDRFVNQILTEIDGIEDLVNVKIIAATNRPNLIDPALLRPGRFDKLILVDIPNLEARKEIIKINLLKTPVENFEKIIKLLADKTEGFVGADIEALVREAGLIALRENIKANVIKIKDFEDAIKIINPSISSDLKQEYKEIEKELKTKAEPKNKNLSMSSYI